MTVTSNTRDIAMRWLAILFPPVCLACRRVEGVESLPLGLCSSCHGRLRPLPDQGLLRPAADCPALTAIVSAWSYQTPMDAVVHALKFGHLDYLGADLADGLHRLLVDRVQVIDVIVPIPLHWLRLRARGFNQAEAIARPLADRLGLPLAKVLRRRRQTAAQARLDRRSRGRNLREAFVMSRGGRAAITGRRILLVDDVVTTGATLQAAAQCLLAGGAQAAFAATAARTPMPRRGERQQRAVNNLFDRSLVNSL